MASHFELLALLTQQMYDDIKFISNNNPTQVVDEDTARMFNGLLQEIRLTEPSEDLFNLFSEMSPRTLKYKDALIMSGQLNRLVLALSDSETSYDTISRKSSDRIQRPELYGQPVSERVTQTGRAESVDESMLDELNQQQGGVQQQHNAQDVDDSIDESEILDKELYGDRKVRTNEDGIVPFDLSDS